MDSGSRVIVQADKTVLRIAGLQVKGLNTRSLEELLTERLGGMARVIGVTGDAVDLDVYGVPEEDILRDEAGVIRAAALAEGITLTDLAAIEQAVRIVEVNAEHIPPRTECPAERWIVDE